MAKRILGSLLLMIMLLVGLDGWFGMTWLRPASATLLLIVFIVVFFTGSAIARLFVSLSGVCAILTLIFVDAPHPVIWEGVRRALFFQAFMTAVFTLQEAALRSTMLHNIGLYLLGQPVQRRSIMVLLGTHVLSIMMNLGSLVLIGSIAQAHAKLESEHDIGQKQTALSALRGFAPSSMWSPLALPPVFISTLLPGIPMLTIISLGFAIAMFMLFISSIIIRIEIRRDGVCNGPSSSSDIPPSTPSKSFAKLALTVVVIFTSIKIASIGMSISIATAVTLLIPAMSLVWLTFQCRGRISQLYAGPIRNVISTRLPQQASETSVIVAAGFMGPMLLALVPFDHIMGYILAVQAPPSLVLSGIFLAIIGLGLVGFNPILSITIAVAAISNPVALGISPLFLMMVLLTAWSLTAQLSPFTATCIVVGRLFNVSPTTLTLKWNAPFFVTSIVITILAIFTFSSLFL
jgi:hypothetical protein